MKIKREEEKKKGELMGAAATENKVQTSNINI
jgi:hypothetical protein